MFEQGYASPNTPLDLEDLDSGDLGVEPEPAAHNTPGPSGYHTVQSRGADERISQGPSSSTLGLATNDPREPSDHVTISYADLGTAAGQATREGWSTVPGDPAQVKASPFDIEVQLQEDRIAAKVLAC